MSFFYFALAGLSLLAQPEHFRGGAFDGDPYATVTAALMFAGAGMVARLLENWLGGKRKGAGWSVFHWLGLATLALFGLWIGGVL